jgi:hypothetical protein
MVTRLVIDATATKNQGQQLLLQLRYIFRATCTPSTLALKVPEKCTGPSGCSIDMISRRPVSAEITKPFAIALPKVAR